jgi:hypothetical protein
MAMKAPRRSSDSVAANGGSSQPGFGIAFKGDVLREQMQLRGLTGSALAGLASVSNATISNALASRRLHPATFRRIAAAMTQIELVPGIESLIASGDWTS